MNRSELYILYGNNGPPCCTHCGLFMCEHKRAKSDSQLTETTMSKNNDTIVPQPQPLGEEVASDLPNIRVADDPGVSANRIPPPPATNKIVPKDKFAEGWDNTFANDVAARQSTGDPSEDWIKCEICKANCVVRFFDRHMMLHFYGGTAGEVVSHTNLPRLPQKTEDRTIVALPKKIEPAKPSKPKVSSLNTYRFRQIQRAFACSTVSRNGRYSDLTIFFLLKNKPSAYSTSYSGNTSYSQSNDWERFVIHMVHDSKDDFYMMSLKMVKRSFHSSYDVDNGDLSIPERICEQHEILPEIRKALLYHGISPKHAYGHFLRMMRRDAIVNEYDDNSRPVITQTKSLVELAETMKKNSWSNDNRSHSHYAC